MTVCILKKISLLKSHWRIWGCAPLVDPKFPRFRKFRKCYVGVPGYALHLVKCRIVFLSETVSVLGICSEKMWGLGWLCTSIPNYLEMKWELLVSFMANCLPHGLRK